MIAAATAAGRVSAIASAIVTVNLAIMAVAMILGKLHLRWRWHCCELAVDKLLRKRTLDLTVHLYLLSHSILQPLLALMCLYVLTLSHSRHWLCSSGEC
jgi:hypothetical protein